ncbi:hypothetical protein BDV93DRAFT_206227 [Ceratobasidium sp. AG-I]|nr:hypothetical protein BDV93DRAFT_206227 [Ceratobasidium sp. AG-I]
MLSDYLNSASCLERALVHSTNQSNRSRLAQVLSGVDKSLSSLEAGALELQNAQRALRHLRNQSTLLAPINRLPAETLTRIFTLATSCVFSVSVSHRKASRLTIGSISSVCSHWRKVALGASSLWCHIDLTVGKSLDRPLVFYATKSLERAGTLPLHVHVEGGHKIKPAAQRIIKTLLPYRNRISSLHLELDVSIARTIISGLFENSGWSSVRELHIHDDSRALSRIADTGGFLFDAAPGLSGFLESLTTLHLCGPMLDASSCAFHGLTELVLDPVYDFAWKCSDLNQALASCPNLRSLTLIDLNFLADEHNTEGPFNVLPMPTVHLKCLEILDLRGNNLGRTILILHWIDTGSSALSLSLTINNDESMDELFKLQTFVHQSRVIRFCLDTDYDRAGAFEILFSFLRDSLPLIEELAFHGKDYKLCPSGPPSLRSEYFPRLHTLHLIECLLDPDALRQAISSSCIQKVQAIVTTSGDLDDVRSLLESSEIGMYVSIIQCTPWVEGKPLLEWPLSTYP